MKHKKLITAAGVTGGLSYLAYRRISSQLSTNAFVKKAKEEEVDQKYLDWLSASNVMQVRITSFDGQAQCLQHSESQQQSLCDPGSWYLVIQGLQFSSCL